MSSAWNSLANNCPMQTRGPALTNYTAPGSLSLLNQDSLKKKRQSSCKRLQPPQGTSCFGFDRTGQRINKPIKCTCLWFDAVDFFPEGHGVRVGTTVIQKSWHTLVLVSRLRQTLLLPPLFSFPGHSVASTGTKLLNPNAILKIKTARDYIDVAACFYELPSISH